MISSFKGEKAYIVILSALVVLLPIFFAPTSLDPFSFGKSLVFYIFTLALFFVWLFSRLQDETLEFPKSTLLVSFGSIALLSLVSAIFSISRGVSLVGSGMEIGTFAFFLGLFVLLFLVSSIFNSEKKALAIYFSLFISSAIVFIYQFIHVLFKVSLPLSYMKAPVANFIGNWNDFGIFFGFIGIISLSLFELVKLEKKFKIFVLFLICASLLTLVAVNLTILWFVFGFFAIILMVYLFSGPALEGTEPEEYGMTGKKSGGFMKASLVVALLVIFFSMGSKLTANIVGQLGTGSSEVRPALGATYDVSLSVFKDSVKNIFIGSGPNTFVYDWAKFKPDFVNNTAFWNTSFDSGVGHVPSMFATVGVLGGLAVVLFLLLIVYYGAKVLSYTRNDLTRGLLFSSYLGALYLWTFITFYSPGLWAFVMATIMTGLFLGLLVKTEKVKSVRMSFLRNQKTRFVYVLFIVLMILGSVYSLTMVAQKTIAYQVFSNAVVSYGATGDLANTETKLIQAAQMDEQDKYYRAISELNLLKMANILNKTAKPDEKQSVDSQRALANSIDSANRAIVLNPADSSNRLQLARVYENLASIKVTGAYELAVANYKEALKTSPKDPSILLALARLEFMNGKVDESKKYIQDSLNMKPDFAQALFFSSQMEAQQGNLQAAIKRGEQVVAVAPNDVGALFQLGLLYYQAKNYDGARLALEKAVVYNPYYSNARYFLGLAYDNKGMKKEAIAQFQKIAELNPDNTEVKKILENLKDGKSALETVSPPAPAPEQRDTPPVEEKKTKSKLER